MLLPFLLVTGIAVAAMLVNEARQGPPVVEWICKPLASGGFVGLALVAGALQTSYGIAVFTALVLSLLGDLLLISRGASRWFLGGLVSFLLAHGAFAFAFVVAGLSWSWAGPAAVVMAVAAGAVLRWLWPHVQGPMRSAVVVYVVVIAAMVALSCGAVGAGIPAFVLAAAVVFAVSDLAVARHRFVAPAWVNRLVGLPLYYGAQLAFAWSTGM